MRVKRLLQKIALPVATAVAAIGIAAAPASADTAGPDLPLEPYMWCVDHAPYGLQQLEAGWQVQFTGLEGTSGQNDYKCGYNVIKTVGDFTIPYTFHESWGIDWAGMCREQYGDTAHLEWIPGPATGVVGAPWRCVGQPGQSYEPFLSRQ